MCTLILGVGVAERGSVLLAANRDEDPARPSDPPLLLRRSPPIAGGRDRLAGGTWLALRGREAAVAMLNRRPAALEPPDHARRSRGLLALDVAAVGETPRPADPLPGHRLREPVASPRAWDAGREPLAARALARARAALAEARVAPFSLVFASPAACWVLGHDGRTEATVEEIGPGWHVLTHTRLDDPDEPRAAWLVGRLAGFAPRSRAEAEARVAELMSRHAGGGAPAVCIHAGGIVTVSSARVWLGAGGFRYVHAEGRPCAAPFDDYSHLLPAGAGQAVGPEHLRPAAGEDP
ncbi:MAG: NRDE family protein [Candidatus Eisenbacteria bacterium]|nr:NRDE family protein [Candidatus Eisenbacteria bacterium]